MHKSESKYNGIIQALKKFQYRKVRNEMKVSEISKRRIPAKNVIPEIPCLQPSAANTNVVTESAAYNKTPLQIAIGSCSFAKR